MTDNNITPLEIYKNPLIYTATITIISIGILIYAIIKNSAISQNMIYIYSLSIIIFGGLTYYMWITICPICKRPLSKQEMKEFRKDIGVKKDNYTYYSEKIQYGNDEPENVESSKKTIKRDRRFDMCYYKCKYCNHGSDMKWNEEKGREWMGEDPKIKIIRRKARKDEFFDDYSESNKKAPRVPVSKKIQREVWKRAANRCQHCGVDNPLEIHHIDGDRTNSNHINNLILLCASCHRINLSKMQLKNESKVAYTQTANIKVFNNRKN